MSIYKSHIYSGVWIPFMYLIVFILLYFLSEAFFIKIISWLIIVFGIILFFYSFKWIDKEMFDIYFKEDEIEIKYVYGNKSKNIKYQDLNNFTFIDTAKNSSNSFTAKDEKFIFNRVVGNDQFISFYQFLKSKNENINIEIYPASSHLEYLRQQEFGIKYRKFLKETL